ncbi:OPT oligopeptide transporter protein-domain-containing protein [Suillus occidentalis]|nr:OPT oligopeptide transporter protein-domain-containing protein [Suillus occidentalis]
MSYLEDYSDQFHHLQTMVWPGTLMLLCTSFTEVVCNWKSIYSAACIATDSYEKNNIEEIIDPVPPEDWVPFLLWGGVLITSIVVICTVMGVQYGQNVGITILDVRVLATHINPVTSIGAAEQAADMINDLKMTHLFRVSPKAVPCGQLTGAIMSIFMAAGVYVIFSTAYPCINDLSYTTCSFLTPDVLSWRAVAVAVSSSTLPIPPSSGPWYTVIGLGIAAVISVVAKHTVAPPKYHIWVLNSNAIGIGFIMNICTYPMAMFFSSTIAFFWHRMLFRFFNYYEMYCFAIAAGFIAGEGLGDILCTVSRY